MTLLALPLFLGLGFTLGSYLKDETVTGYLPAEGPWLLQEIDGGGVETPLALRFSAGRIALDGPCLRLRAAQEAPYPWFEATGIDASANTCPLSKAETVASEYLAKVNVAEVSGDILILSEAGGVEMVFRLSQP